MLQWDSSGWGEDADLCELRTYYIALLYIE